MKINLSPVRMDDRISVIVDNDIIIVNDVIFDFNQLADGESLPADAIKSQWICGPVHRVNGEINITLVLPHGANAPYETRFPAAFTVPMTVISGPVPLPPYDVDEEETA